MTSTAVVLATLFDDWEDVAQVVATAALGYVGVLVLVRVSGKRALAQLNAFDWIVTVAFGSALATMTLSADVSVVEGLAAFATLSALQYAVTLVAAHSPRAARIVKNEPALLIRDGQLLHGALRRERLSVEDVLQVLRSSGVGSLDAVEAAVLETDGTIAVIRSSVDDDLMRDVSQPEDD